MWVMGALLRERLVKALQRLEFLADEMEPVEGATLAEMSQEAHELILELQQVRTRVKAVDPPPADPRILRQVGKLRLVAPARKESSRSGAYLNGALLIERRETDALGAERWVAVTELRWGGACGADQAVFRMLAGDGWDDRELREYDKP